MTWNNQPGVTTEFQIETTASTTQWNYNLAEVDVTQLVKLMKASGNNYGFALRLINEQTYRSIVFSSSEADDQNKRPKLTVTYKN